MTFRQAGPAVALLSAFLFSTPATSGADAVGTVITLAVPEGGKPVVARTDRLGIIHLLYDTEHGPNYARSSDQGLSFGAPIPVAGVGPRPTGLEYSAWDMAIGKGGRVHVAMGANAWKLKRPLEEWAFFCANLDAGAPAFSPVRNINRKPSEGFSLAADERGKVTACWLSDKLYANVSHDNGETFEPYIEINSQYNPCNCCTTSAAYDDDGKLAVLYREETNNERDMYLVLWDQDRGEITRNRVSRTRWQVDACPMTYFTVVRERRGFVAVWPTKGQICFARLEGTGHLASPAEIKTPGRSGMRTGMIALNDNDGNTLVAWKNDGQTEWQLYDVNGRPRGSLGSAKSPGNGVAGVVRKDGRFLLFR